MLQLCRRRARGAPSAGAAARLAARAARCRQRAVDATPAGGGLERGGEEP